VFGAGAEKRSDSSRGSVWCRGRGRDIFWRRSGVRGRGKASRWRRIDDPT